MTRIPLTAALAVLLGLSAHLAATRVYQADECYSVTMARLLSEGRQSTFRTDPGLFMLALSGLSRGAARSRDLFANARLAMLALFWLNLVLLAACTGERPASRRGLIALLGAACLAPLWDYGIEIRHDNLLLTGLLATWYLLRVRRGGPGSYFAAGALAAGMQFVAFKAPLYTLPLSAIFLVFPAPEFRARRPALIASWAAGAAAAFAAARWVYGFLGLWPAYLADLRAMSSAAESVRRMLPLEAAGRFAWEAPLLLVLLVSALRLAVRDAKSRRAAAWESALPEAAMVACILAVLLVNPTPYAYNLLYLVPFAFLLVYKQAPRLMEEHQPRLRSLGWTVLILAYFAPFAAAVAWESLWANARQVELMNLAEEMTDPARDPVLDGVGLVPTRPRIGYLWLLDTLHIRRFWDGSGPSLRVMLARNPAAVFLPNYRTDWLTQEDRDFIDRRYVSLSDDFRVLGAALPPGGGDFETIRTGRYWFSTDCTNGAALILDGATIQAGVLSLSLGLHHLKASAACRPAVVWLGPNLNQPPRLAWRSHRRLFVDWY